MYICVCICAYMCMLVCLYIKGNNYSLFLETLMSISRCDLSLDYVRPWGGFVFHPCDTYNAFFLSGF